jgi:hypothetical protein
VRTGIYKPKNGEAIHEEKSDIFFSNKKSPDINSELFHRNNSLEVLSASY